MTNRMKVRVLGQSSSSARFLTSTKSTSTSDVTTVRGIYMQGRKRPVADKDMEAAVYAHVRAVRALGRTTINTLELSRSLGLPLAKVEKAVSNLRSKGIKIVS